MRAPSFALASGLLLVACGDASAPAPPPTTTIATGTLARSFDAVAARTGVPRSLLVAIAAVEGGLELPAHPEVEEDAPIALAGPLQLRRGKFDTLARGAALVGVSETDLRRDADLALEAGALVLAELGAKFGAREGDLGSWARALEEMSGYADEPHRRDYARQVYARLASGGSLPARDGEVLELAPAPQIAKALLEPVDLFRVPLVIDQTETLAAEYPTAEWIPTSCDGKCNPTRGGAKIEYVVVHDTEGGWHGSVATLQNDPGKSAHYIIGQDGRIGQFVNESVTAWHCGNGFYNTRSIGIEHVGWADRPFPEKLYETSAKLVSHLAQKYSIPRDRAHVIGHDQVPNGRRIDQASPPCALSPRECQASPNYGGASGHHDPGIWQWCPYMAKVSGACKCNDAWANWNCATSLKEAFRCSGGKVEVIACDGPGGCEVKPVGTPDVCNRKAAVDAGVDATTDAPADARDGAVTETDAATDVTDIGPGSSTDALTDTDTTADGETLGDDAGTPDTRTNPIDGAVSETGDNPIAPAAETIEDEGGCAVADTRSRSSKPAHLLAFAVAAGATLGRRRRRR
jgi:hypothetical protein